MAAPPPKTRSSLLDPLTYWQTLTFALAAVALAGFIASGVGGNGAGIDGHLEFDWAHNIVHLVLAAVAFLFGFSRLSTNVVAWAALVGGAFYLILGGLGFAPPVVEGLERLHLHLEWAENVLHLGLGAWGLATGIVAVAAQGKLKPVPTD